MATTDTGASQEAHQYLIDALFSNKVVVRMMGTAVDYEDSYTELNDKEVGDSVTTDSTDWESSSDSTTRSTTVSNSTEIKFGATNVGTVVQLVLDPDDGTERYAVVDEVNEPNLTGEDYSFPAGEIEYTLGGT